MSAWVRTQHKQLQMVGYGPQAPMNATSHSTTPHISVSHTRGVSTVALQRCGACVLLVVCLEYVWPMD